MRIKQIKKFCVLSSIALLGTLAVGCSNETSVDDNSSETKEGQKVITALVQQSRYFEGLQAMIEKLKVEENIVVDVQVVPDAEALNIIKLKLNSGEAPDIIDFNIPAIYDIVDPEANFADMTNESWTDRLIIPDNVISEDGKIYGFPFLSVPGLHGFIYNKDVFAQAGIETLPATWEEFLVVCETLKETGVTPIHMPKDSWVPQILMTDNFAKALGTERVKELADKVMNNEMKWTDVPEFAQVLDQYLALYENGYVNDNFRSAIYDDSIAAVADGTAAMHFNGDFFAASVMEANPDANIGMFTVSMTPGVDTITQNMSSAGFVAYKHSKNLDTVKEVFNLGSTPEYANLYFESRPAFPAFEGVDGGDIPSYLVDLNENYIKSGNTIPEFNHYFMNINALFDSTLFVYYVDAPAKGNMNGADILEKFQKDFEQYMKDQQTPGF